MRINTGSHPRRLVNDHRPRGNVSYTGTVITRLRPAHLRHVSQRRKRSPALDRSRHADQSGAHGRPHTHDAHAGTFSRCTWDDDDPSMIDRRDERRASDAFSPGASATTFWPFVRRTDPRAECRRARAETEDLPNDRSGISDDGRGRLQG
ncbi:unnamed protein product [Lasius platythorax]|uniref:Uncharacterized protein n=1 Tax=Lasius platythorax TaxID=488582 RepID=A0AAV2NR59_9HYME